MNIHGKNLVAGKWEDGQMGKSFQAINPRSGETLEPDFHEASPEHVNAAICEGLKAFDILRQTSPKQRAAFLETLAREIESRAEAILQRAQDETALGEPRLQMELARTIAQPRVFAGLIREGSWVEAKIDRADPTRKPFGRPSMRSMLQPIGPIAVFGASNFPLAISVVGTDTICAFAAGCPVIVKAHPAHPGTCVLTAEAVTAALHQHKLPAECFSLLQGASNETGQAIVRHPDLAAVAFTGSLTGGRAIMDAAAARKKPIPVFAEMGSLNPVFLLPEALETRGKAIAEGFLDSLTMGVGQFCTNPGVLLAFDSPELDDFLKHVSGGIERTQPRTMLHSGIYQNYNSILKVLCQTPGVKIHTRAGTTPNPEQIEADTLLLETDYSTWCLRDELRQECFGPASILIRIKNLDELLNFARNMEGSLTATIHGTSADLKGHNNLIQTLETHVGRLVYNGFPTGVEIGHATHHGGPYPAASSGRHTSIGIGSIYRFVRPVCYQNCPDEQLPPELQDNNPKGILRKVDGIMTDSEVSQLNGSISKNSF
ncbi:MAG: aldehyde dehydrogenase (NADP(+)) [Opitutales bacterium]|nr:aldehyde dehydrogenase (NADP(+)) [Opitutales bacterium]